jgi:hypothetical protein
MSEYSPFHSIPFHFVHSQFHCNPIHCRTIIICFLVSSLISFLYCFDFIPHPPNPPKKKKKKKKPFPHKLLPDPPRPFFSLPTLKKANSESRKIRTKGMKRKKEGNHSANPVPSPVHRYKDNISRRFNCCSPKSSGTRPLTCASAERMTFRKFL